MASLSHPSHATITILPCDLSLVHIPRSRVTDLSRPILKQLLRKDPKFLNLTANEIELSIFVEDDAIAEFEDVARRDRIRQRHRERSESKVLASAHRSRPARDGFHPVETTFERWKVLQIDSHDDSLSNSGSRVRELSGPLALAGISILYQSSYMSDFIFVKASRLAEVMKLLDANGFSLYDTDAHGANTSYFSQDGSLSQSLHEESYFQAQAAGYGLSYPGTPGSMSPHPHGGAVLSRTRSPSHASLTALSLAISRTGTLEDLTQAVAASTVQEPMSPVSASYSSATSPATRTPKKSMSPTAAPVEVLSPDMACVGLNESAADIWAIKILTLIGFPELIPSSSSSPATTHGRNATLSSPTYASPISNPRVRRASSDMDGVSSEDVDSPLEGPEPRKRFSLGSQRFRDSLDDPSSHDSTSPTSQSPCSSSDEEEYFSSSSPYTRTRDDITATGSTPSLVSSTTRSSARSLPDRPDMYYKTERPSLGRLVAHSHRLEQQVSRGVTFAESLHSNNSRGSRTAKPIQPSRIPFFSFTRTAEGSSLTTDLGVLSALFDRDERHMVICQTDLLEAGDELNEDAAEKERLGGHDPQIFDLDGEDGLFEMDEDRNIVPGMMKCLQIDLRKFGLDKHGLVNRFSRVLEENGINHMYSSTFKTANLLVDKSNAKRAQLLLRSC